MLDRQAKDAGLPCGADLVKVPPFFFQNNERCFSKLRAVFSKTTLVLCSEQRAVFFKTTLVTFFRVRAMTRTGNEAWPVATRHFPVVYECCKRTGKKTKSLSAANQPNRVVADAVADTGIAVEEIDAPRAVQVVRTGRTGPDKRCLSIGKSLLVDGRCF